MADSWNAKCVAKQLLNGHHQLHRHGFAVGLANADFQGVDSIGVLEALGHQAVDRRFVLFFVEVQHARLHGGGNNFFTGHENLTCGLSNP